MSLCSLPMRMIMFQVSHFTFSFSLCSSFFILVFSQSVYFANISEQSPLNKEILRVHATDNDVIPINKEFIYRIPPDRSQYENRQHLRIDAIDGRIYLKKNFDREKSSTISLPIEAVNNQSSNMLIGRAVLVINVLDVNDNYPRFAENYSPRIREHFGGRKILEFKITDPDDQTNGKNKFEIKLGKIDEQTKERQ